MSQDTEAKPEATIEPDRVVDVNTNAVAAEPREKTAADENVKTEEFRIQGDELVAKVKTLIHEGNIRRIILKNETGHTLIEIPLTVGVVGSVLSAALFPVLAAVGAIGAVVAHLTLAIEKRE
ncbi:DUF4342 domain-containing protein [Stenomitos frigidus]|uniref:DUF4342 domain-containing protein n=1 Tax=Stenomitos frigidus ULC18 TaxID=2107698 RepID=A0A2T1EQF9_9CYAN|nr:DUF4342 domain-containing protein [Stenomitos frigidus]PSB34898.1 hypothetical protein C7B82_01630 [Stenomitos frigidus ULC18]